MKDERQVAELVQEIDSHLRAIRRALRKPLEAAIARGELTAPQRCIMQILARSDGLSLKELSRRAELAHSTVSGIVDRLEKRGMLSRQPNAEDARFSVSWSLTRCVTSCATSCQSSPCSPFLRPSTEPDRENARRFSTDFAPSAARWAASNLLISGNPDRERCRTPLH